ncbi:MAG TPA: hypothetical protein VGQ09_12360 [Chitinophagaceae bacterium]|jgi:hypothetical protein|nr:hypothetical protein [Chitinophagaceae bacterium]
MLNLTKIKLVLSGKAATLVILILAIIGRVIQLIYFFNIRVDRSFQIMATDNLLHGHGISTAQVFANDLSTIIYQPLIKWPPGYSLIMAPFYAIFNHNYIAAGLTVDIIFAVIFILITRSLLKLLNTPGYLVNIYTLVSGFFMYDFYVICTADAIAITFFLIAFHYTLSFIKSRSNWIAATTFITVFLLFCAATKYSLMPAAFVIPLFLIVKGIFDHNAQIKKAGVFSLIALSVCLGALLLYQKNISGSAAFVSDSRHGFFPENLFAVYPLFPAAFIKPETLAQIFDNRTGAGGFHFFQWIYVLFLFIVLTWFVRRLYKNGFKGLSVNESFLYLCFFVSFAVVFLLVVLSVIVAKTQDADVFWTFIQEPRYYGLPAVLIQLIIFALLQYSDTASKIIKYLFYFFLLLLSVEMFHGVFFDVKRIIKFNKEEYSWQSEDRFQKYAAHLIDQEQQKHSTENTVVSGWYYLSHRISLFKHIPILYDVSKINDSSSLNAQKPVTLLVFLHKSDLPKFQSFLSEMNKEVAGYFNEYYFYACHVNPH